MSVLWAVTNITELRLPILSMGVTEICHNECIWVYECLCLMGYDLHAFWNVMEPYPSPSAELYRITIA